MRAYRGLSNVDRVLQPDILEDVEQAFKCVVFLGGSFLSRSEQ